MRVRVPYYVRIVRGCWLCFQRELVQESVISPQHWDKPLQNSPFHPSNDCLLGKRQPVNGSRIQQLRPSLPHARLHYVVPYLPILSIPLPAFTAKALFLWHGIHTVVVFS